jgi:hypothetical protein
VGGACRSALISRGTVSLHFQVEKTIGRASARVMQSALSRISGRML